ncbi:MAG: hypothetical protein HRU35_01230 [Rickettsiaceae bacterium]|nr:hypothetical protein [Rickettsiaceae bacterium]
MPKKRKSKHKNKYNKHTHNKHHHKNKIKKTDKPIQTTDNYSPETLKILSNIDSKLQTGDNHFNLGTIEGYKNALNVYLEAFDEFPVNVDLKKREKFIENRIINTLDGLTIEANKCSQKEEPGQDKYSESLQLRWYCYVKCPSLNDTRILKQAKANVIETIKIILKSAVIEQNSIALVIKTLEEFLEKLIEKDNYEEIIKIIDSLEITQAHNSIYEIFIKNVKAKSLCNWGLKLAQTEKYESAYDKFIEEYKITGNVQNRIDFIKKLYSLSNICKNSDLTKALKLIKIACKYIDDLPTDQCITSDCKKLFKELLTIKYNKAKPIKTNKLNIEELTTNIKKLIEEKKFDDALDEIEINLNKAKKYGTTEDINNCVRFSATIYHHLGHHFADYIKNPSDQVRTNPLLYFTYFKKMNESFNIAFGLYDFVIYKISHLVSIYEIAVSAINRNELEIAKELVSLLESTKNQIEQDLKIKNTTYNEHIKNNAILAMSVSNKLCDVISILGIKTKNNKLSDVEIQKLFKQEMDKCDNNQNIKSYNIVNDKNSINNLDELKSTVKKLNQQEKFDESIALCNANKHIENWEMMLATTYNQQGAYYAKKLRETKDWKLFDKIDKSFIASTETYNSTIYKYNELKTYLDLIPFLLKNGKQQTAINVFEYIKVTKSILDDVKDEYYKDKSEYINKQYNIVNKLMENIEPNNTTHYPAYKGSIVLYKVVPVNDGDDGSKKLELIVDIMGNYEEVVNS